MATPGKPPKHDVTNKKLLDKVRQWAAEGLYDKDIAALLGYTAPYFCDLKRANPELSEALRMGVAEGLQAATHSIMTEVKNRNMTATIFYLKCKGGWRDNAPAPTGGDDSSGSDTESLNRRILERVRRSGRGRGKRAGEKSSD